MNSNSSGSDGNFVLLDVRTSKEFAKEKIEGAINIDIRSDTFKEDIRRLMSKQSDKILIYCRSGGRSKKAQRLLSELGYSEVYNLREGIAQWIKEGFPTTV